MGENMKQGRSIGVAELGPEIDTTISQLEFESIVKLLPVKCQDEADQIAKDIESCFTVLFHDDYASFAPVWVEARPELLKTVTAFRKAAKLIETYVEVAPNSPEGGAMSLTLQSLASKGTLTVRELYEQLQDYQHAAELVLHDQKAKACGRPADDVLHRLVEKIYLVLLDHDIDIKPHKRPTADDPSNRHKSDFWSLIIQIASRIRQRPNAGRNSMPAALEFVENTIDRIRSIGQDD